jgi:hypothetical protein
MKTHTQNAISNNINSAPPLPSPSPAHQGYAGRVPEERVFIHPASVNFTQGVFTVPWLVYSEVVRTSRVSVFICVYSKGEREEEVTKHQTPTPTHQQAFVRDCSEVSPYALLLAARTLKQAHSHDSHSSDQQHDHAGTLLLDEDGWVRFAAVGRIGALVAALKKRVDALLGAFCGLVLVWLVCGAFVFVCVQQQNYCFFYFYFYFIF